MLISVVLSFRNEAGNIPSLISRLDKALGNEGVEYELLFVNDASTDRSLDVLVTERARNPRVKIVNLSRRFGVAEGVLAGIAASSGDAVIYMDADLQDPPEVVPALVASWRGGAEVVHTVRTRRHGENPLKMLATRWAYRVIQYGSTLELPVDAGDFKLLSRRAADHLLTLRESDPYLRGLVVWLGFNQAFVPYERERRHTGRTHFPFFSKNPWKTFVLGMTSFSFLPIYMCVALASAGLVASIVSLLTAIVLAFDGSERSGRWGLIALVAIGWTTVVGAIGAIGLYIIRIYKDVRGRPLYVVQSTIGLAESKTERARV